MTYADQFALLKLNPPRLRQQKAEGFDFNGGNRRSIKLFVIQIYSHTVGGYMTVAERIDRDQARRDLSENNRDYLRTLRTLRRMATTN